MPLNLEEECKKTHLPPFRAYEIVHHPPTNVGGKEVRQKDYVASIDKMVRIETFALFLVLLDEMDAIG